MVHSLKLIPASGWRTLMPWGHTAAHTSQETPSTVSRHFASFTCGTKVRFALPMRLRRALMGQKVLHHLRKNTT
ncbi:hypothetical protein, partial [Adlercreutzia sp. DFI.6.23]|uniref:hypothetical protein n=1 Tax=Adlercreutzia sp. DFI.6.23 TaxID=2963705 RepID=UPI00210CA469